MHIARFLQQGAGDPLQLQPARQDAAGIEPGVDRLQHLDQDLVEIAADVTVVKLVDISIQPDVFCGAECLDLIEGVMWIAGGMHRGIFSFDLDDTAAHRIDGHRLQ